MCTCLVPQLCLAFCDPMDCSPPGSSVHGILQARILEWVAILSSRESSQPSDWTKVSHITGRFFIVWAAREAQEYWSGQPIPSPRNHPNPEIKPGLLYCRQILYQLSYQRSPSYTTMHVHCSQVLCTYVCVHVCVYTHLCVSSCNNSMTFDYITLLF